MTRRRTLLPLLVAAALSACASAPTRLPGEAPWTSGRLSVRVEATQTQAAQSVTVAFDLRAQGDSGELLLNTPLGTRVASARWALGEAVLVTADGERRFDNLDALSRQALGESLPLAALPDWLAGRPWPGASSRSNADGFEQMGWQVNTARRSEGFVEAQRSTSPAVSLKVRLDEEPR